MRRTTKSEEASVFRTLASLFSRIGQPGLVRSEAERKVQGRAFPNGRTLAACTEAVKQILQPLRPILRGPVLRAQQFLQLILQCATGDQQGHNQDRASRDKIVEPLHLNPPFTTTTMASTVPTNGADAVFRAEHIKSASTCTALYRNLQNVTNCPHSPRPLRRNRIA